MTKKLKWTLTPKATMKVKRNKFIIREKSLQKRKILFLIVRNRSENGSKLEKEIILKRIGKQPKDRLETRLFNSKWVYCRKK
jgi:hypothetical protein